MPKRTPDEVRWNAVHMHALLGYDNSTIAQDLQMSERSVCKILSLWQSTGAVRTSTPSDSVKLGRPRLIDFDSSSYLHARVAQTPSLYLDEIQNDLEQTMGLDVHTTTISRALQQDVITQKKCSQNAKERSDEHRDAYQIRTAAIPADYFVCVDERAVDRRTVERDFGLSLHALDVVKGSFTAQSFRAFIAKLLNKMNPYPAKNSIIFMDNCRIHKDPETLQMITARGMQYIFLPPYSPNFNPIELAFSKIKQSLKRDRNNAYAMMGKGCNAEADTIGLIYKHVYSVTTDDAQGWFRHCQYF
ncbi:hypothetical protein FRC07_015080 [Ceratobasidium sp. 392]|nr:hypothetical protein FRC07_015080 [Ceratobasidium sp. 392]